MTGILRKRQKKVEFELYFERHLKFSKYREWCEQGHNRTVQAAFSDVSESTFTGAEVVMWEIQIGRGVEGRL